MSSDDSDGVGGNGFGLVLGSILLDMEIQYVFLMNSASRIFSNVAAGNGMLRDVEVFARHYDG